MAYKLANAKLNDFLASLCEGKVVFALTASEPSPGAAGGVQYHLDRADKWLADTHVLGDYRPVEPLKALVFRPREFLGTLKDGKPAALPEQIVIGAKSCDVSALQIHDHVFLATDPVDPYYKEAREKTIIVSCDCTAPRDVCFCTAVGEQPYPKEGFDINLSPTRAGIIVETGSARGEALLEKVKVMLREVDEKADQEREAQREAVAAKVEQSQARQIPDLERK